MMISYSSTATTESQPPRDDGEVRMSVCNRDEPDLKFSFSFSFVRAKPHSSSLASHPRPPQRRISYPTYCAMPTVVELKAELRELGLPTYGLKAELQSRLRAHYCDDRNANASNNDGEEANNDDDNSRPRPQDHPSCNGGGSGTATVGGRASLTNRASATKEETKVMINGSGSSSSKNNNANGSSSAPSDNANDESSSSSVSSSVMKKRRNQSNYTTMIGIVLLAILIANVVPVLDVDLLPESIQGRLLPLLQRYRNYYDSANNNTPPRHATTAATTTTTLIGDNRDTSTPIMSYETDVTNDEKLNLNTDDTDIGGGDEDVVMNDGVSEESVIVAANNDDDASMPPVVIEDTPPPPPPPPPRINAHRAGRMGDVAALTAIGATDIGLLNIRDANGWTPLHEAARGGHLEAVKFLIDIGLDKVKKKIQGTNHSVSFFDFFFFI